MGELRVRSVVFLLDVDNTLLDNDRFLAELGVRLERDFGATGRDRYWDIYAALRKELGYADYLGALQRFRAGLEDAPALLQMSAYLLDYPFERLLFPQALEVVAHLRTLGRTAIFSDGDIVYQPRKIQRAGLWSAVSGEVFITIHKQHMLGPMRQRYPADHYVMVDDKPELLAQMKQAMGDTLTALFVRQGKYAAAARGDLEPAPDRAITAIGELLQFDFTILEVTTP